MSCVHIVTRLNVGGIARYLDTARDAVDLLLRGRVEGGETDAPWEGAQRRVPGMRRSIRPADDVRALAGLVATLRRVRPDVIHTHASKAGVLGRLAARVLGIPAVHTFHGHVLDGYFARPVSRALLAIERWLARGSTVTATGPATAADLEARLGVPVRVVRPGIELPAPAPDACERWRHALGSPRHVALAVGRGVAIKGLFRFVSAAREAGYLPVIAGATQVPGALCLGHVDAMQDLYAACDVVVSASAREGTPFSLLEAAWCGRPAVATPVGDSAWVVGRGGIVTDDLASALRSLRDAGLRAELGETAASEVRRRFPADAVAPRLRALYGTIGA